MKPNQSAIRWGIAVVTVVLLLCPALLGWYASADEPTGQAQPPPAKPIMKETAAKEATLTGRIVDLHCYMTGDYATADHAKCTAECIKKGVSAALETATGLVLLGNGMEGTARKVELFALQNVQVRGKIYEKHGLKYLDITEIKKADVEPTEPANP